MKIHPTAVVSTAAHLEEGVEIGPYSIIGGDVNIGKNTVVGPHVVIGTTDIGAGLPYLSVRLRRRRLDLKFRGNTHDYQQSQYVNEFVTIIAPPPPISA